MHLFKKVYKQMYVQLIKHLYKQMYRVKVLFEAPHCKTPSCKNLSSKNSYISFLQFLKKCTEHVVCGVYCKYMKESKMLPKAKQDWKS